MMSISAPSYAHLASMTDKNGLYEHALYDQPRREEGYCLDDVSRAVIVASRETSGGELVNSLLKGYLDFVDQAIVKDGRAHNRRNSDGEWTDKPSVGDWWGRAIWSLGSLISSSSDQEKVSRALEITQRAIQQRSPFTRSNVFAVIGASELLVKNRKNRILRTFVEEGLETIPRDKHPQWVWPEPRMTYANGSLAEVLMISGIALGYKSLIDRGLELTDFLLRKERYKGNLSVTGSSGQDFRERKPQFDQQPIEVSAIADASVRAYEITRNPQWLEGLKDAWRWFNGDNDSRVLMYDIERGAGFDGLEKNGRNENRGAESTLAALSTHQHILRHYEIIEACL